MSSHISDLAYPVETANIVPKGMPMLREEDWMDIKEQVENGTYQKDIAERIGISQKTVQRAHGARDAV